MTTTTITIKRETLRNRPGSLRPFSWIYSYTTPVDVTWNSPDGTSRPGPRAGEYLQYGKGLGSLRDMLRRKYGRDVELIQDWPERPR